MENKVLFILKRKEDYCEKHYSHLGLSTGLFNSATFVNDMLNASGIESKLVVVVDNNDIDREVTLYRPTHVVIEALWVVPEKFPILEKLHPTVKWIVRLHSEVPFIANEGIAMGWIGSYLTSTNVIVAANAPRMMGSVIDYANSLGMELDDMKERIIYLPNYYPQVYVNKKLDRSKDEIDVSCFGAIRPLKNHLEQAFAAIKFADIIGKKLRFHINKGRYEGKGEPVYKNLVELFGTLPEDYYELVEHEWTPREEFLELCASMDLSMQFSFSETFNIVACDSLVGGVPTVGTGEIPWMSRFFTASPTSTRQMCISLLMAYVFPRLNVWLNRTNLRSYTTETNKIWKKYFTDL